MRYSDLITYPTQTSPRRGTPQHWWWNIATKEIVFTMGYDHTSFAACNAGLFNIPHATQEDIDRITKAKSRNFDPTFLRIVFQQGWVRCGIDFTRLSIEAETPAQVAAALAFFSKDYDSIYIDVAEDDRFHLEVCGSLAIKKMIRTLRNG